MAINDGMSFQKLGRSGLAASRIVLGAMNFGDRTDEAEARRIVDSAAEHGVNFIDTADTYAGGRSEEIVGSAIAANRHHWILATKLANAAGPGVNQRGLSRKWMIEETHNSLRRLGTDFIDVLYLHKEDRGTPIEETVRAIAQLQRDGAIRYFGVSNYRSWRVAQICAACDAEGIDRPVVLQPPYNALDRSMEVEILPACAAFGIGVAVYSPTGRGLLSGKYAEGELPPPDSRGAVSDRRFLQTVFYPEAMEAASRIADYARGRGTEPSAFAVAWVLANPIVTGAVVGPRNMEQWDTYLKALAFEWSNEDERFVSAIVPPGCTAVRHYVDPQYPIEGRPLPV